MPRNRFEAILIISRELKSSPSRLARARLAALRRVAGPSRPMTLPLTGPASKNKIQFAFSIFRVRPWRWRFLTTFQPGKKSSVSIVWPGGKRVACLIRMVHDVLLADIWAFRALGKQKVACFLTKRFMAVRRRRWRFCEKWNSKRRRYPPSEYLRGVRPVFSVLHDTLRGCRFPRSNLSPKD